MAFSLQQIVDQMRKSQTTSSTAQAPASTIGSAPTPSVLSRAGAQAAAKKPAIGLTDEDEDSMVMGAVRRTPEGREMISPEAAAEDPYAVSPSILDADASIVKRLTLPTGVPPNLRRLTAQSPRLFRLTDPTLNRDLNAYESGLIADTNDSKVAESRLTTLRSEQRRTKAALSTSSGFGSSRAHKNEGRRGYIDTPRLQSVLGM